MREKGKGVGRVEGRVGWGQAKELASQCARARARSSNYPLANSPPVSSSHIAPHIFSDSPSFLAVGTDDRQIDEDYTDVNLV